MEDQIRFWGGAWMSTVPLAVFILATTSLVIAGAPVVEGMIIAAMGGISLGMLAARRPAIYTERVFALMANRTATVAIVAWLWAGAFLRHSVPTRAWWRLSSGWALNSTSQVRLSPSRCSCRRPCLQ